jgi:DNA-binding SARP family transcriptional activator
MENILSRLEISLLGSPQIELDGAAIEVDTRKAIAMLAYLAMERGPVHRESLVTLLWPESDTSRGRAALRRTLSALNKALDGRWLEIERDAIDLMKGNGLSLDIDQFRELLIPEDGHGHDQAEVCLQCEAPVKQAIDLYRGDFLSGFTLRDSSNFDDWQFYQTDTLRRELEKALDRIIRIYIHTGEFDKAIDSSRRRLTLDPLHEATHRTLMRLYAWSGQRAAAMRQYRECVRILDQELKVAPLEETTELNTIIKMEQLDAPILGPVLKDSPLSSEHEAAPLARALSVEKKMLPLVGREVEWDQLKKSFLDSAHRSCFVLLEGEVGIGKTRLAEEFITYLRKEGAIVLASACYEGESNLAFGPFVEAIRSGIAGQEGLIKLNDIPKHLLTEAARLLPEIKEAHPTMPEPAPLDSPGAQARFFEGVRQVILALTQGNSPGLFFLDDLHFADEATLDLLTYVVRRTSEDRLCVLGCFRSEELASGHRLRLLLSERQRAGAGLLINLRRLKQNETNELIAQAATHSQSIPADLHTRLHVESEGLPFLVNEYLMMIQGTLEGGNEVDWTLPESMRGILRSKISTVPSGAMQLLTSAAAIGGPFDFEMIRQASGRGEEEVVEMLEDLQSRGLIKELVSNSSSGEAAYAFQHEKLRALVYDETSQARKRLLHRRIAEALSHRDGSAVAGQMAYHYQRAGMEEEARDHFIISGDYARTLYANNEALSHYSAALELGYPDPAPLMEKVGDLHTLMGEYTKAIEDYENAVAYGIDSDRPRYERKLGMVYHRKGNWNLAERHFESAFAMIRHEGTVEEQAALLSEWALSVLKRGDMEGAQALANQALELSQTSEASNSLAQSHNIIGILARDQGDLDQAESHLQKSLLLAQKMEDNAAEMAARNNLALVYADKREFELGLEAARAALEISVARGDRHREAALLNNIADLLQASGQTDEAIAHVKQSVAIYAEIGVDADEYQPEIWKLIEW